jgi:hypothetical protein
MSAAVAAVAAMALMAEAEIMTSVLYSAAASELAASSTGRTGAGI